MPTTLKRILTAALALLLLFTLGAPAFAAEETGEGAPESAEAPATAPPEEPATAPPATAPPATPAPATPPPATAPPMTPEPTEAPGTVNLHLFVYTTDGTPAAGYRVSMGDSSGMTSSSGQVNFPNLAVAQQRVQITSPGGESCVGRLYMSRSGSTGVTDQAMGGTYGVDVARGQSELYMVVTFVPGEAMDIRAVSDSQPALPTQQPAPAAAETAAAATEAPSASETVFQVKALTATFVDAEGQAISGMQVGVTGQDGTTAALSTNAAGAISVPNAPYGTYMVSAAPPGAAAASFALTINPGIRTAVVQNTGEQMIVEAATTADHLYLQFTQTAAGFVLSEASDTPIGGDMTALVVGIIVVVAVVIIVMLVVVHLRRRSQRQGKTTTMPVRPQRKVNYDPSQTGSAEGTQPRRTGGANKFDDRYKM